MLLRNKLVKYLNIGSYTFSVQIQKNIRNQRSSAQNLKFDYLICGFPRTGSKAVQEILTSHEDVYVFCRNNLDDAFSGGQKSLLKFHKAAQRILKYAKNQNIKTVLITHHWHQLFSKDILNTISYIVDQPIVMIRKPRDAYLSSYNNAWYYSFKKSAYYFGSWHFDGQVSALPIEDKWQLDTQHKKIMKIHKRGLDYSKFYELLCQTFEKPIPILDFSILKNKKGIGKLFNAVGVKENFMDFFLEPQQDAIWRYGHRNPIQMNFLDYIPIETRYVFKEFLNETVEEPRLILLKEFQWDKAPIQNLRTPRKYFLTMLEDDFLNLNAEQKSFLMTSGKWVEFNGRTIDKFYNKMDK